MGHTTTALGPQSRRQFVQRLGGLGLSVAGLALLSGCGIHPPWTPEPTRVHRIGFLSFRPQPVVSAGQPGPPDSLAQFAQALHDLGYVEGRNVSLEARFAENREDRLPDLAADLVRLSADVIVVDFGGSRGAPQAARQATDTIPIVVLNVEPETFRESGLIASVAHPGGNVTGFSGPGPEIRGKQLELLAETVPGASRVAVLWDVDNPTTAREFAAAQAAARQLGVELHDAGVRGLEEVDAAVKRAVAEQAGALFVIPSSFLLGAQANSHVIDLVARHRLPTFFGGGREHAERGGLMAYWRSIPEVVRRAATYVDKILKGARPADLPVEGPTKYDFVINLKTAQALGLVIPQSVLLQATEVIQ